MAFRQILELSVGIVSPASNIPNSDSLDGQLTLGQALRSAREAHGVSLDDVAATLRIKATYLAALEVGQFEQLPGTAYALGFVRTYAEYLGLNGPDAVQRFKTESTGGQGPRSTLTFPSPAPRGRVPGVMPLLIALLAAAAIIGAWFLWRSEAQSLLSRVPEVPERLMALVQSVTGPGAETPPQAQGTPAPAGGAAILPPTVSAQAPTAGSSVALPPAVTSAPTVAAAPPAAVPAPPVPPQPPIPAVAEPVRHLAPIPPPVAQAPEDQPPPPPEDTVAGPAVAAAPPPPPPVAAPPTDGRVFGAVNDTVRVIIRSKGESWVQVRDADNQAVMTRVLRAGDQYRVPNRPGLTLMTGNAGALEVTVDGQPAPALGPTGMVRRAVPLDPDRLKQGTLE